MPPRIIIAAIVSSLLVLAGCGGGGKSTVTPNRTSANPAATTPGSAAAAQLLVRGGPLGTMASASIRTTAGTSCSIVYTHPSGKASTAQGLDPKVAGADGIVSWSFLISPTTTLGGGEVAVTCGTDRVASSIIIGPVPVAVGDSKLAVIGGAAGTIASATMHSTPGASCAIAYTHPSGQASVATGLDPAVVGGDGTVSWSWVISTNTSPGTGTVAVTCDSDQASAPIVIGVAATPAPTPKP